AWGSSTALASWRVMPLLPRRTKWVPSGMWVYTTLTQLSAAGSSAPTPTTSDAPIAAYVSGCWVGVDVGVGVEAAVGVATTRPSTGDGRRTAQAQAKTSVKTTRTTETTRTGDAAG